MGNYNPTAPQHLGLEWVPIRDETLELAPDINVGEFGHGFTATQGWGVGDARFYLKDLPPGRALGQVFLAAVYPRGAETLTGPIKKVIIPCNATLVSGGAALVNATTGPEAVADPSDNAYITMDSLGTEQAQFFFATNQHSQRLNGKRILAVDILYVTAMSGSLSAAIPDDTHKPIMSLVRVPVTDSIGFGFPELVSSNVESIEIKRKRLGEINFFWSTALATPSGNSERLPWRYTELQNFELSAAASSRIAFSISWSAGIPGDLFVAYVAMEVTYCEETRVAYGGRSFGQSGFVGFATRYATGANIVPMYTPAFVANPILVPDDYLLTLICADIGDVGGPSGLESRLVADSRYPGLNALRQLYEIAPHPGIRVDRTLIEDEEFGETALVVLPQLSLHVTGTGVPVTDVHVYGRQAHAPVYGAITATQEIYDDISGTARNYTQVRYYARRFGNTTIPLLLSSPTISGTGQSVYITPAQLDALDELIDGWREVTLRFDTVVSMGAQAGTPNWVWSAANEVTGNRYEVLGATAPAVSGINGTLINEVPSAQRLSAATYQPTSGTAVNLNWQSPAVSGIADDPTTDAVLIFAVDPPAITGLAVTEQSQAVTGIGLGDCSPPPGCVPTGIGYHRLTWPDTWQGELDTFNGRTSVTGWGTSDSGHVWSILLGDAANFFVTGGAGVLRLPTGDLTAHNVVLPAIHWDVDIITSFHVGQVSATNNFNVAIRFRSQGVNDYYRWTIAFDDDGTVDTTLTSIIGGAATNLDSSTNVFNYAANQEIHVHVQAIGSSLRARIWTGSTEPTQWQDEATEATFAFGQTGYRISMNSGNTNVNPAVYVDDVVVTPYQQLNGTVEIQRWDAVDQLWQTIMLTAPYVAGFRDYEARVGVMSSYRIRTSDSLNFHGLWSAEVSNTLAVPGVSGVDVASGILIFTTNEIQDGSANLAYAMVWDRAPEEVFDFPETDDVTLERMYGRNYQVAFRPLERGGERFQRTLLVQSAAVSPPVLDRAFQSLRDLAWADVSYVCVRTEEGDRWLATVIVPQGTFRRDREMQVARVTIVESTATPSPADVSAELT